MLVRAHTNACTRLLYLCKHGLAILSDHRTLVTVQRHKVVMEGLLRVL